MASAELLAQPGLERPVDLDRVDVCDAVGKETRQDAEARADLEHDVVGSECGEPFDHAEDVLVGEEVLAVRPFRDDVHGSPKTVAALASICAASASGSSPRASARAATVCAT